MMKTTSLAQRESSPFTPSLPAEKKTRTKKKKDSPTLSLDDSGGGLLQLKLGRAAHTYGLVAAFALLANAFFVYWVNAFGTSLPLPVALDVILWLLPLVVGGVMAAHAIDIKWTPFYTRHKSRHFALSVAAFVVAMVGLVLTLLLVTEWVSFGPGLDQIMYPYSVTAMALALVSMASTWSGHGVRKMLSLLAAIAIPLLLSVAAFAGMVPTTPGHSVLAMLLYFGGALAAEISGSMLHIIASSTTPVQREILRGSEEKLLQLQQRVKEAAKALEYKQKGLFEMEAIVESERSELETESARVAELRRDALQLETQAEAELQRAQNLEEDVARREAEMDATKEEYIRRHKRLSRSQDEVEKLRKALGDHEKDLAEREKTIKRGEIDFESAQRHIKTRLKETEERETRLADREEELEAKNKALLQGEKDLQLRASELETKFQEAEATRTAEEDGQVKDLQAREGRNLEKERALGEQEVELQSMQSELERMSEDAKQLQATLEKERKRILKKDSELVSREKDVFDKEEGLKARAATLADQEKTLQSAEAKVAESEKEYSALLMDAKLQQASATKDAGSVSKREAALAAQQKKLDERETTLRKEIQKLNKGTRTTRQREKELDERESMLSLRELEIDQKDQESRAVKPHETMEADRAAYLDQWENRLREREEQFKREQYQREKQIEMRESAIKASIQEEVTEASEVLIEEEEESDRVNTGTRRLDDLLYGGLPFGSSVLWVGPAFAGKEVGILNFIAEGLRKGVPAVIVTTTKPPVDIAKEMAPILPTFIEFEQLGLVRWVDCSDSGAAPAGKYAREGNTYRVAGPKDFDSLLAAVSDIDGELQEKHRYFRLAFLTLSSSIPGDDGGAGVNFIQRLVNRLRRSKSVNAFGLERGMHTDQQLEMVEHLMDGAIHFRNDKQGMMLSVVGVGDVQSRDWIPYKFTNKALIIGSFQLERIR